MLDDNKFNLDVLLRKLEFIRKRKRVSPFKCLHLLKYEMVKN